MTSERDKCGLTSLLPISCRDRAEAFAKSLQSRLSSLGSQDGSSEEKSWLGSREETVSLSQPLHNPDTERYLALEVLESPCSPQEEVDESDLHKFLNDEVALEQGSNGDFQCTQLKKVSEVKCNGLLRNCSGDSDSEVFYDLDEDPSAQVSAVNGLGHPEPEQGDKSETGIESETFATSVDCTPQPSISEEVSTLSIEDDSSVVKDAEDAPSQSSVATLETDLANDDDDERNDVEDESRHITIRTELTLECSVSRSKLESIDATSEGNGDSKAAATPEDDDDDDNDEPIPRVRRCSSLKTGKTPPGTPSRKKIVRFADVLGLDLADVRTFLDEVPKVPQSAYNDLSDVDLSDSSDVSVPSFGSKYHGIRTDRILVPLFEQPSGLPNFLDQVRDNQVCLENALVDDPILFSIKGTVRVRNLDFHKSVHIRYSLDSWKTFADVQAVYQSNSCDGFSDRFSFSLYAHTLSIGQKLEFACRFQCKGCQYWDSNKGKNYCFQCLPASSGNTTTPLIVAHGHSDWGASFY